MQNENFTTYRCFEWQVSDTKGLDEAMQKAILAVADAAEAARAVAATLRYPDESVDAPILLLYMPLTCYHH
jgi:hypothetical protein